MTDKKLELARECEYWAHETAQIWSDIHASAEWGEKLDADLFVLAAEFEARLVTAKADLLKELHENDPD